MKYWEEKKKRIQTKEIQRGKKEMEKMKYWGENRNAEGKDCKEKEEILGGRRHFFALMVSGCPWHRGGALRKNEGTCNGADGRGGRRPGAFPPARASVGLGRQGPLQCTGRSGGPEERQDGGCAVARRGCGAGRPVGDCEHRAAPGRRTDPGVRPSYSFPSSLSSLGRFELSWPSPSLTQRGGCGWSYVLPFLLVTEGQWGLLLPECPQGCKMRAHLPKNALRSCNEGLIPPEMPPGACSEGWPLPKNTLRSCSEVSSPPKMLCSVCWSPQNVLRSCNECWSLPKTLSGAAVRADPLQMCSGRCSYFPPSCL